MQLNDKELPSDAPKPRLCHIVKWSNFDGYGFNLHADKSKSGQYIGKVDADSPAEMAGLRELDRIIEVNGVNISNENHKQAVQRIKSIENETKLLVVDVDADKWYKENKIVVKSDQSNVIFGTSKLEQPAKDMESETTSQCSTTENSATEDNASKTSDTEDDQLKNSGTDDDKLKESSSSSDTDQYTDSGTEEDQLKKSAVVENSQPKDSSVEDIPINNSVVEDTPIKDSSVQDIPLKDSVIEDIPLKDSGNEDISLKDSEAESISLKDSEVEDIALKNSVSEDNHSIASRTSSSQSDATNSIKTPATTPTPPSSLEHNGGEEENGVVPSQKPRKGELNLNMTAAEMRAQLSARKKADPRNQSIDLKKKYEIIQNM